MRKVYKYEIGITDQQLLVLPLGAKILTVALQERVPCLWVEVDSKEQGQESVHIYTHGTGHVLNPSATEYIGTYFLENGLVFHVYTK